MILSDVVQCVCVCVYGIMAAVHVAKVLFHVCASFPWSP